ncbi:MULTISPECIES: SGNH/GDSL hydrolase family protein [unclassified Lentimonas]|uniref:SGNH/GDSL hydrolase family protein n=1 Tax=unclassified Lentimonas TaxID=2630993 RepID=UPI00132AF168|nr:MULTISPECIES: SGNH/GDSL hydrolase family protein [unclassified Lentimonas]CAA6692033.1 lipolytic enzyme, G-D-S-L family [Lentimonas sp. CC10]CAA6694038.1 lipolytic enzyme, G-D-S-L family [Lentimonas sp. CC19]CAA7070282.1 lipolytic enzyme, G-D-S-L family [Lentimonas sp. CC11]
MKISDQDTLLFIGDSITDCGRPRPVGERGELGDGYVNLANSLLATCHPEIRVRVLNTGISGNRITDLEARWRDDVLAHQPDWLSIMIGINDVWRQFDNVTDTDVVNLERFENVYRQLLSATRPNLKGLVLMTPFYLETNPADPMRAQMDAYGAVVKRLAEEFDAVFVDVQAAFDAYLEMRPTQTLCSDRVHPNQTGHLIIAKALFKAIGAQW